MLHKNFIEIFISFKQILKIQCAEMEKKLKKREKSTYLKTANATDFPQLCWQFYFNPFIVYTILEIQQLQFPYFIFFFFLYARLWLHCVYVQLYMFSSLGFRQCFNNLIFSLVSIFSICMCILQRLSFVLVF